LISPLQRSEIYELVDLVREIGHRPCNHVRVGDTSRSVAPFGPTSEGGTLMVKTSCARSLELPALFESCSEIGERLKVSTSRSFGDEQFSLWPVSWPELISCEGKFILVVGSMLTMKVLPEALVTRLCVPKCNA
jgi:hypothetical protein